MGNKSSKNKRKSYFNKLSKETKMSPDEMYNVIAAFQQTYPAGMNKEEFAMMLSKLVPSHAKKQHFVIDAFNKFDANNDGKIDLQEFLVGFSVSTQSSSDEKIRWIFNIYDKNRDGHISKMEMQDILKKMIKSSMEISNATAKQQAEKVTNGVFKKMDKSEDNKITFQEFKTALKEDPKMMSFLGL